MPFYQPSPPIVQDIGNMDCGFYACLNVLTFLHAGDLLAAGMQIHAMHQASQRVLRRYS